MAQSTESSPRNSPERIVKLFLTTGTALVWNADDVEYLRERHRIVGNLIGSLPRAPCQNRCLGLPLQLSAEETRLLLDEGLAQLCETKIPSKAECEKRARIMAEMEEKSYQDQVALAREEKRQEILLHQDKIRAGMQAKRQRRAAKRRAAMPPGAREGVEEEQKEEEEERVEEEKEFDVDSIHIPPLSRENALVQLFIESPWEDVETETPPEWNFPQTTGERRRYAVFRHFWKQGKYITPGGKFGGDFLLYEGDPSQCHALYVAKVLEEGHPVTGRGIVAMGRAAHAAKKTFVACSVDLATGTVTVQSLKWAGF